MNYEWTSRTGIDTLVVLKAILTMRVIPYQDGSFVIRANGRELKATFKDRQEVREVAERAIERVVLELAKVIGKELK